MKCTPFKWKWGLALLLLAIIAGVVVSVFPWRSTGVTPVVLKMQAPADSQIELVWSPLSNDEAFRLVPWRVNSEGEAEIWLTEVPPRLRYEFKLHFKSSIEGGTFYEMKAFQLAPEYRAIWTFDDRTFIPKEIAAGELISFERPLEISTTNQWSRGVRLLITLLCGGLIGLALWFTGLRFPERLLIEEIPEVPWKRRLSYTILVLCGLINVYLLAHSIPDFWPADSTTYALKGLSILKEGTYDVGGYEFEFNRLPGYPLFIALSFAVFGESINALMLFQGIFTLFSLIYLLIVVRVRWIRDEVLWVVIPLSILSPAMIWGCRQIATEGIFVGVWLLSTAWFLQGWASEGKSRWIGWSCFTLGVVYATYIRANGILLLVLPGCYCVGLSWRCWLSKRFACWRMPECWKGVGILLMMTFVVIGSLALWGYRNWKVRGYPYPTDLAPIVAANGSFNAGMLDFRAVAHFIDYETAIRDRYEAGYFYHGWRVRNRLFVKETNQWKEMEGSNLKVDAQLYAFAEMNTELIPFEARLMSWWRVLDWGLWFPHETAYTRDYLTKNYSVETDYENGGKEATVLKRMDWLNRKMGIRPRIEKGAAGWGVTIFNQITDYYDWYYRCLVLASMGAFFVAIRKKRYAALALMAPFWVNVFLNVYFLYVVGRYVQVFDSCLVLGIAIAFGGVRFERRAGSTEGTLKS